jgi:hypothetical protein
MAVNNEQQEARTMTARLIPSEAVTISAGAVVGSEGHRRWHVLSRLGSGAFGAVYKVEEEGAEKDEIKEKFSLKVCLSFKKIFFFHFFYFSRLNELVPPRCWPWRSVSTRR